VQDPKHRRATREDRACRVADPETRTERLYERPSRPDLIADVDDSKLRGIWVDDANPIFRRGITSCLRSEGFRIAGESALLDPEPDLSEAEILLFPVDDVGVARACDLARRHDVRLVGLVRAPSERKLFETVEAGLSGVLVHGELTPARLTTCLRAVIEGNGTMPPALLSQLLAGLARGGWRGGAPGALVAREVDVLRLLAEGASTRDISEHLAYSERTVKNIVRDVLVKLNCRTRAHAVGLATRQGVI
jgi:DNA-binding NarL/FixJ family response regulator